MCYQIYKWITWGLWSPRQREIVTPLHQSILTLMLWKNNLLYKNYTNSACYLKIACTQRYVLALLRLAILIYLFYAWITSSPLYPLQYAISNLNQLIFCIQNIVSSLIFSLSIIESIIVPNYSNCDRSFHFNILSSYP